MGKRLADKRYLDNQMALPAFDDKHGHYTMVVARKDGIPSFDRGYEDLQDAYKDAQKLLESSDSSILHVSITHKGREVFSAQKKNRSERAPLMTTTKMPKHVRKAIGGR